uniref:Uncharacterized protein n=1 Tax=Brassica campestris TaxID=3711 RepID=A0A3P5ZME3_BRACM|nr:unnamed protein product [Brassica rapa]
MKANHLLTYKTRLSGPVMLPVAQMGEECKHMNFWGRQ